MDQNKVGELIKKLRKENHLTQEKFAEKYGVTYQAVSKWENGKNIPDISLLKQICKDYNININDLLEGDITPNKKESIHLPIIIITSIIALIIILFIFFHDDTITFKTVSSSCSNFEISGSIAYNKKNSYLYISNIDYCGKEDNTNYQTIECILYETTNNIKKEIGSYKYQEEEPITLNNFLKNVTFTIDNFTKECQNIKDNNIELEINAYHNEEITTYKIPLSLNKNCN